MQDKLLKDLLKQLTRIADALETKNKLEEKRSKTQDKLDKLDEKLKKGQIARVKSENLVERVKPNHNL
jgi:ferritin-like metal-binding protein YciE